MVKRIVLKLTHRIWNREISRLLCRACEDGTINSQQLHVLASWFDPTQEHKVYFDGRIYDRLPSAVRQSPICSICGNHSMDARFHHAADTGNGGNVSQQRAH